jgi:hypothetical protein
VVIAGHISNDTLGLNPLLDVIEKHGPRKQLGTFRIQADEKATLMFPE